MATRHSPGVLKACADAVKAAVDGGKIRLYSGSQPTSPKAPATGTLIGEITPVSFDAAVVNTDGTVSLKKPTADNWRFTAVAGTIGWARIISATDDNTSSDTQARIDMSVSTDTGTGDLKLAKLTFAAGDEGGITDLSILYSNGILPA